MGSTTHCHTNANFCCKLKNCKLIRLVYCTAEKFQKNKDSLLLKNLKHKPLYPALLFLTLSPDSLCLISDRPQNSDHRLNMI